MGEIRDRITDRSETRLPGVLFFHVVLYVVVRRLCVLFWRFRIAFEVHGRGKEPLRTGDCDLLRKGVLLRDTYSDLLQKKSRREE